MLLERPNPAQVTLQVTANNNDGTPKTVLQTARVRVYHIDPATNEEQEDLSWADLTQVGSSNVWRYIWSPSSLQTGQYFVEYSLIDMANAEFVGLEDLCVQDFAMQTDVDFFRKLASGRWKIDLSSNRMIFYDEDGLTPIAQFLLKDRDGIPSPINVFERVPV